MKTALSVLNNVLNENATLLADDRDLLDSNGSLDRLCRQAGLSGEREYGNDLVNWSGSISSAARDLCERAAHNRAEKLGVGNWDDLEVFLDDAK